MFKMQIGVIAELADAPAFAHLHGDRARDHVARREILHARRVTLHEALALVIGEITALAARALGDEAAGAVNAGRVELHELHVLQRQSRAQHHGVAVAGAGVGAGAGEVGAAVAARGQDHDLRLEAMQCAVVQLPRGQAPAGAGLVHDQIQREVLDEEVDVVVERLAVQGVQHGVAGAVGRRAGALDRGLAEVARHAAEGALVDLALVGAREGHAPVLQFVHRRGGVAHHVLDGLLVAEPVRTLDGVVHVPAPIVLAHVAQRSGDAALGRHGVRAGGEHLGYAGGLQTGLGAAEGGPQARSPSADHHHVELVIDEAVSRHVSSYAGITVGPKATLRMQKIASAAARVQTNRLVSKRAFRRIGVWI